MVEPLIRIIDVETTDLSETAQVCEVGWTDVRHTGQVWVVGAPHALLLDPGQFITPDASGVHHITDAMVKGQPPAMQALRTLANADVDIWCAHYAAFDRRFFDPVGSQWIDTYKCAVRQCPDAPNHKNQTLRYYLGLNDKIEPARARPPHRAGPDSYVTAHLLVWLLQHLTVDQMVAISSVPALLRTCYLKKHRGKTWEQVAQVDARYLEWYLGADDRDPDVEFTCRYWLGKVTDARGDRPAPPIQAGAYLQNPNAT